MEASTEAQGRRPGRLALAGMAAALLFLGGVGGFAISAERPPGRGSVEVGFLHDMIRHHEQAQVLANLELQRGAEEGVRVFAREALLFQSYEIGLMEAYLDDWGYARADAPATAMAWMGMRVPAERMVGLATEAQLDALNAASGRGADALFVTLLIGHHQGGVHMASYAAQKGGDERVRALAARISKNQQLEIGELEAAHDRLGLPEVKA